MRFQWQREHLGMVVGTLLISFLTADEEPLLELSDFNLAHVWVLVFCVAVTYFDLTMRARYGQHLSKDTLGLAAAFTFAWGLENYLRLLLLVFCLHSLMPLEMDLLELVEMYQAWGAWVVIELLPAALLLILLLGVALSLNQLLAGGSASMILLSVLALCVGQAIVISLLAWDLVTAGLSSIAAWETTEVFYMQPKTALTHDRALGVGDQFEWHRERGWPYSLRFEDLYFFLFQLLLIWDLLCSLFFWCCIAATALGSGCRAVSYTQVAIGVAWLEHACMAICWMYAGLFIIGLRVWFQSVEGLGSSWV